MNIRLGRDICGELATAETREWLVTNGIGGYASGTVAGLLTRHYHGLLVAALQPPVGRALLLAKLDETIDYQQQHYELYTNRWLNGTIDPPGYQHIERFQLEGTTPVWTFALGDALLRKQIWMRSGENTTYIRYTLERASSSCVLSLKALVNYRDHHGGTTDGEWRIDPIDQGFCMIALPGALPLYVQADRGDCSLYRDWYRDFALAVEQERGTGDREDHLHAATFWVTLQPGESWTIVASTNPDASLDAEITLAEHRAYETDLLARWQAVKPGSATPDWIRQLVLAADQFIVKRSVAGEPDGKTVIAGYPWFGDWGRDTMISLPGLTIATGRPEVARPILRTFARYLNQGMLPNLFPDAGHPPEYNTVDAILWYFEAIRAYYTATQDEPLLREIFPALAEVIDWHCKGTRYHIHRDNADGLIYAGEPGVQLTWMDAKIGDWVVTPRIGKPVEVNALWYNALRCMVQFATVLGQPSQDYQQLANQAKQGFQRFWNPSTGYCYDVLDTHTGDDDALRPNQIFAVSLPTELVQTDDRLLSPAQQKAVVDVVAQKLLTSHGLRSLAPSHSQYSGHYGGNQLQRDSTYHQGTVWGWLIGPFVQAHWQVYHDSPQALSFLASIADHLQAGGLGSISEIFDGNPPHAPKGCFAQAWSVAEVLRVWRLIQVRSIETF